MRIPNFYVVLWDLEHKNFTLEQAGYRELPRDTNIPDLLTVFQRKG